MTRAPLLSALSVLIFSLIACTQPSPETMNRGDELLAKYTSFKLTTDLDSLSENQRAMLPLLIEACQAMDDGFWLQAYGDKQTLLEGIADPQLRRFAEINYGPWDRLDGNTPFIDATPPKPAGARYYPADMSKDELAQAAATNPALTSLYTLVVRREDGSLQAVPYNEAFREQILVASSKLREAADLAEDPGFKRYLELRADALEKNDYFKSDLAWMEMKNNRLDIVIGPIENYEDQLFNYKASFEGYVLIKDPEWSQRLARYAALLPEMQRGLPVEEKYKQESPGTESDLNAYDVVYYAGDCNAGSKTIAINLPNDERVQDEKGSRRLQLKNAMRAKFEKILMPISEILIAPDQRQHISFDAFFENTMFHEVAHGLGIKNTINDKGPVRRVLKEQSSALEEGKADVLGLYLVTKLHEMGELGEGDLMDNYVTFLCSIFRSIRFGASSAHGRANVVRFNFFKRMGAFEKDTDTLSYRVNFGKMREAMNALSAKILMLQGNGDYDGVKAMMAELGQVGPELNHELDRLAEAGIPVDVTFEQGTETLGL